MNKPGRALSYSQAPLHRSLPPFDDAGSGSTASPVPVNLYSIWPCLALLAAILLLIRLDRPFQAIDTGRAGPRQRFPAIDGLRGLLAFGVFGHHAALMHDYLDTGIWRAPPSAFYTMIGQVGVAMFFAITGFLFWGKLLDERGAPDWKQLYVGRVFRIAPAYLAAVTVMLLVVWNRTYFELREPAPEVLVDTARWLGLGIFGQPDVNGYRDTNRLLAGVTWTLRYEWIFYFFLPLLAVFARKDWHPWFALAGLLACCAVLALWQAPAAHYCGLFFCGMIPASLMHRGWRIPADSKLAPALAAGCLWLLFTRFPTATGVAQTLLMGVLFCIFGLGSASLTALEAKPVRRLGEISYSVYLIHGLVLMAVFSDDTIRRYAMSSHVGYWLAVFLSGLLLITAATLCYVLVERPGIRLGKYLAGRVARARPAGEGNGRAPA